MALAASVVGSQVPLAAVTLETLGLLLEVLGEVPSETAQLLQAPLMQKLTCQSSLLRKGVGSAPVLHFRMQCSKLNMVHFFTLAAEAAGSRTCDCRQLGCCGRSLCIICHLLSILSFRGVVFYCKEMP